jgi:hypothetical protein
MAAPEAVLADPACHRLSGLSNRRSTAPKAIRMNWRFIFD